MSFRTLSKSTQIQINKNLPEAFDFFTPEGERWWVPGWNPEVIRHNEDLVKEGMVFITKGKQSIEKEFIWYVCELNKDDFFVKYLITTQNRTWFVDVICTPTSEGKTQVKITYTYHAFNEEGYNLNKVAIKDMFAENLKDWETAINYFIENDRMISS